MTNKRIIPIQISQEEKKEREMRVESALDLIVECLEVNQVDHGDAVSAMASFILTVLCQCNEKNFYALMDGMKDAFEKSKRK